MILYVLLVCSLLIAAGVVVKLKKAVHLFRVTLDSNTSEKLEDLPTVSICIPARNEMHAMTMCLENALSSNYPKLEIIVLDDGSRDTTGHLIKSFAHSGVRFVEGSPLPDGWLGKNHALEALLKESSGSLVVFADVDTIIGVDSISQLVSYVKSTNADMVSVLPYRFKSYRSSVVLATFRHFWNIIGHKKSAPAVASNLWMIKRTVLVDTFQGFGLVANSVRPEREIARKLSVQGTYRFIISNKVLGVAYEKKLSSQFETSVRIYYPDFGLVGVFLRCAALLIMVAPYVIVLFGLVTHHFALAAISFAVTLVISSINAWFLDVLRSSSYGLASICLPFIMLREIYLLIKSVVMYKLGRVTWKGRPVALPKSS